MSAVRVNDSEVVREIAAIRVNDGGIVREIQEIRVNDGGVIRSVFSAESIVWVGDSKYGFVFGSGWARATYQFDIDGGTQSRSDNSPLTDDSDWCDSHPNTTGADYEIRTGTIIDNSGSSSFSGFASNTTYNLGTSHQTELERYSPGGYFSAYVTIPIIIREDGGSGGTSYSLYLEISGEN